LLQSSDETTIKHLSVLLYTQLCIKNIQYTHVNQSFSCVRFTLRFTCIFLYWFQFVNMSLSL